MVYPYFPRNVLNNCSNGIAFSFGPPAETAETLLRIMAPLIVSGLVQPSVDSLLGPRMLAPLTAILPVHDPHPPSVTSQTNVPLPYDSKLVVPRIVSV